jgi:hypothetical protein
MGKVIRTITIVRRLAADMEEERVVFHNVQDVGHRVADMGEVRAVVHNARDVGHRVVVHNARDVGLRVVVHNARDVENRVAVLGMCQVSVTEYLELCSKIMDGLYLLYSEE